MAPQAVREIASRVAWFEAAWVHDGSRKTVRALIDDALLETSASLALLEPAMVVEEAEHIRTQQTYRSIIKLGMFLSDYEQAKHDAPPDALDKARGAVTGMLDALTPYVLRKDNALRLLEPMPRYATQALVRCGSSANHQSRGYIPHNEVTKP